MKKIVLSFLRIMTIADKEWIHIRRDSRSLVLAVIEPALLVILFGYALNMDVKNVSLAVLDHDRTSFTRQMIEKFSNTEYLAVRARPESYAEIDGLINSGEVSIAVVVPAGFTRDIRSGREAAVQLLIDGSDSMSSTVAAGYVTAILQEFNVGFQLDALDSMGLTGIKQPVDLRTRIWYNEELQSKNLIIPGIIVIILAIISALITSLAVSREWERGTMETLITTPVRPYEVVVGKLLPYLFIGAFDVVMTFIAGYFIFDISLRGSFGELMALSLLFLVGTSLMGIFISSATKVQVLSIQAAMIVTYLPSFILSGFVFPVANMPYVIQAITYLVPATYMMSFIKWIVLKGLPASMLAAQIVFMAAFAAAAFILAVKKLRLTVDD